MSMVAAPPRAGWYPDPLGTSFLRWWDVIGWTQHTALVDGAPPPTGWFGLDLPAPDPDADLVVPEARPAWADWTAVAAEVRGIASTPHPLVVHLQLDDLEPVVIDTRYQAYGWVRPIAELPRWVFRAEVIVQPRAPLAPTVFALQSGPLAQLIAELDARAARV
jgi:hypothetical protein